MKFKLNKAEHLICFALLNKIEKSKLSMRENKGASSSLILKMVEFNTPFGKNFLNETSENGEMVSNSPEFYYLAAVTSSNVIISVFCLLYLNMKLSLNKFIKGIL